MRKKHIANDHPGEKLIFKELHDREDAGAWTDEKCDRMEKKYKGYLKIHRVSNKRTARHNRLNIKPYERVEKRKEQEKETEDEARLPASVLAVASSPVASSSRPLSSSPSLTYDSPSSGPSSLHTPSSYSYTPLEPASHSPSPIYNNSTSTFRYSPASRGEVGMSTHQPDEGLLRYPQETSHKVSLIDTSYYTRGQEASYTYGTSSTGASSSSLARSTTVLPSFAVAFGPICKCYLNHSFDENYSLTVFFRRYVPYQLQQSSSLLDHERYWRCHVCNMASITAHGRCKGFLRSCTICNFFSSCSVCRSICVCFTIFLFCG